LFFFFAMPPPPPQPTLFPYTTLFRSRHLGRLLPLDGRRGELERQSRAGLSAGQLVGRTRIARAWRVRGRWRPDAGVRHERPSVRSEEHTSELQSRSDLVCRLLLEKKK